MIGRLLGLCSPPRYKAWPHSILSMARLCVLAEECPLPQAPQSPLGSRSHGATPGLVAMPTRHLTKGARHKAQGAREKADPWSPTPGPCDAHGATMRLCGADHPALRLSVAAGEPLPQGNTRFGGPCPPYLSPRAAGTSSTSPQAPTRSPMMITAPSTPSISGATARARLMSPGFFT